MKRTVTDRGFTHMEPVTTATNETVRVYESSSATQPRIWLEINGEAAHLSLKQASQIERQLRWLRKHHYQLED